MAATRTPQLPKIFEELLWPLMEGAGTPERGARLTEALRAIPELQHALAHARSRDAHHLHDTRDCTWAELAPLFNVGPESMGNIAAVSRPPKTTKPRGADRAPAVSSEAVREAIRANLADGPFTINDVMREAGALRPLARRVVARMVGAGEATETAKAPEGADGRHVPTYTLTAKGKR